MQFSKKSNSKCILHKNHLLVQRRDNSIYKMLLQDVGGVCPAAHHGCIRHISDVWNNSTQHRPRPLGRRSAVSYEAVLIHYLGMGAGNGKIGFKLSCKDENLCLVFLGFQLIKCLLIAPCL